MESWYDVACFAIVGMNFVGAFWVLGMNEHASQRDFDTAYATLLLSEPDREVIVNVLPRGHVSTSHLWTTCWRGLHPLCLLLTRFFSLLILLLFLAWDFLLYNAAIFFYYTEWTFILAAIYFTLGTIVSAYGCWQFLNKTPVYQERETNSSSKLESRYVDEDFQQRAGFWGYFMQATYQLMGCLHVLNAVFLLLDTALNNLPFPWFRISYFILWSCGYVIVLWLIHAFGLKWWPYPFLDLNTKLAPIWKFLTVYTSLATKARRSLFLLLLRVSEEEEMFGEAVASGCVYDL
ncbi:hypothetical protein RJT34_19283 [Clitoria ternatea]|uniref:Uncharacterized protein n=1 Tax=Clitoria ternatea TaxID=43366 RepID=A0AAN9IR18_CLITE